VVRPHDTLGVIGGVEVEDFGLEKRALVEWSGLDLLVEAAMMVLEGRGGTVEVAESKVAVEDVRMDIDVEECVDKIPGAGVLHLVWESKGKAGAWWAVGDEVPEVQGDGVIAEVEVKTVVPETVEAEAEMKAVAPEIVEAEWEVIGEEEVREARAWSDLGRRLRRIVGRERGSGWLREGGWRLQGGDRGDVRSKRDVEREEKRRGWKDRLRRGGEQVRARVWGLE
jgi:hypothetical protein